MTDGRLIYVVGPSGGGKDSVISAAKKNLFKIKYLCFSPRYVTRATGCSLGELSISANAFEHYRQSGYFALHWQAHGLSYGVGAVIDQQLRAGRTVVVNGSRAHLDVALGKYPRMTVVHITVPNVVARQRLLARAREDATAIAARLERVPAMRVPSRQLITIDNSGALEDAVQAFEQALTGNSHQRWPSMFHHACVP